jgi:Prokaryotic N-terminal methylation motif
MPRFFRHHRGGFTLVEMLVSILALTLFVLMVTRLVNSASTITTIGNKHMGADSQARSVLDRMAVDIAQMVKRSDVDYYLKNGAASNSRMTGNDQIAFFSTVPGYYPSSGSQSPVSLVAYRVNANQNSPNYNKLERMGKGLLWNGVTPPSSPAPTAVPMVFLPSTISSIPAWSGATQPLPDPNYSDPNYELIGPYVFRFEYYYLIRGQTVGTTDYSSTLSYTPWDTRIAGHTAVNGFQDVSAIGVTIAVIDSQSRVLVSDTQLGTLIGLMTDFSSTMQPGALDAQWQSQVNSTTAAPRTATSAGSAASAIHIYSRLFPIAH